MAIIQKSDNNHITIRNWMSKSEILHKDKNEYPKICQLILSKNFRIYQKEYHKIKLRLHSYIAKKYINIAREPKLDSKLSHFFNKIKGVRIKNRVM